MDIAYMGKLMLSAAIFAPGLILFAALLFVGLIMVAEKSGVLAVVQGQKAVTPPALGGVDDAREPGPIVSALNETIAAEKKGTGADEETSTGTR